MIFPGVRPLVAGAGSDTSWQNGEKVTVDPQFNSGAHGRRRAERGLFDSTLSGVYFLATEFVISQRRCANDAPDATDAKTHTRHTKNATA